MDYTDEEVALIERTAKAIRNSTPQNALYFKNWDECRMQATAIAVLNELGFLNKKDGEWFRLSL